MSSGEGPTPVSLSSERSALQGFCKKSRVRLATGQSGYGVGWCRRLAGSQTQHEAPCTLPKAPAEYDQV